MTASPQTLAGDGLRLSCDVYGNEDSPTVLLLHGGGQTRHSWQAAAQALQATGMCAIAVDLRGHGDSDWAPADRYEIGNFASDVARICTELPAPPVIVGASLGGLAALIAVGESPVLIARALVLVDIAPRIESDGSRRVLSFMSSGATGFADLTAAAEAVAAYQVHRRRPADPGGLLRNLRQRPDGRWYWHWDPAFLNQRISVDRSAQSPEHLRLAGAAGRRGPGSSLSSGRRECALPVAYGRSVAGGQGPPGAVRERPRRPGARPGRESRRRGYPGPSPRAGGARRARGRAEHSVVGYHSGPGSEGHL
jgi:pimeloyl-ACP methyl ester carboxylesterase